MLYVCTSIFHFIYIKMYMFSQCSCWDKVCVFSLRQMEQNVIDLTAIEAETKEKIAAANRQKVSIAEGFMTQMKVRIEN